VNCFNVKKGEERRAHMMRGQINKNNWKTVRAEERTKLQNGQMKGRKKC
jgi:hypothetical protein